MLLSSCAKGNAVKRIFLVAASCLLVAAAGSAQVVDDAAYDPLAVDAEQQVEIVDLTVHDAARDRAIPIRCYLPRVQGDAASPAPVILFSHGLGGSRNGNPHLGQHWAKRGFVCVFLQHAGSDSAVWRGRPVKDRKAAMDQAASANNSRLRYQDVPMVLDQLERWNADAGSLLFGRLDLDRIGMSGHSFGAKTTQGLIGQRLGMFGARYHDPRIDAAVILSPSAPKRQVDQSFAVIDMPVLLLTGTKDVAAVGNATVEDRLAVFSALPAGDKYELVFDGGTHSFLKPLTARSRLQGQTNASHAQNSVAFSTAFWEAYLMNQPDAKAWLGSDAARASLDDQDRWQMK